MSWCAASAVLNHGAVAPSSRAGRTRVPTSMQLVLLEHSIAQSSVGLCREMIVRAVERLCPVVVVCVQRQPQLYPSGVGVHVIDYDERALRAVADKVITLADAEDLPGHGDAVKQRFVGSAGR